MIRAQVSPAVLPHLSMEGRSLLVQVTEHRISYYLEIRQPLHGCLVRRVYSQATMPEHRLRASPHSSNQ